MDVDEQFDQIIQDALSKSCDIDCSIEEYIRQLEGWQSSIRMQLQCSQDDLEREEGEREAQREAEDSDGD